MPVIISDDEFSAIQVALATMTSIFDAPVAEVVVPKVPAKKKAAAKAAKPAAKTTKVVTSKPKASRKPKASTAKAVWADQSPRGTKAYSLANKAANKVVNACIKDLRSEDTREVAKATLATVFETRMAAGAKSFALSYQPRIVAALAA
jgi:hypothetical protein|tara:strand:- start:108 stop:551 length:444 start_codon:yes stop_codon:yes gene_type:complete